jgi:polar amino acid transport system substrate-binding protein
MKSIFKPLLCVVAITVVVMGLSDLAKAGDLLKRAKAGETIKIGYANDPPFAFPSDKGEPVGQSQIIAVEVLKRMGITKIEGVLTEWSGLIPGLNARRFDAITAGMYIKPKRCANVLFSQPTGVSCESILVKKGNPMNIHSWQDIANNKNLILVTAVGFATIDWARRAGIPDDRIMKVADQAAMLQALLSGRAHAISQSVTLPDYTRAYSSVGFRHEDQDFVKIFNEELAKYLGTPEMMKAAGQYGYTEDKLPDPSIKAEDLCKQAE